MTYDRSTVLPMTNKQTFTGDKNAVWPMTKIQFDLWQIHLSSCDKNHYNKQALLPLHPQWRKWLARWALHNDTNVVGSSLTQVAFFLEKIPNSILLLRLDNDLGYATNNVLKFFIHCKPMITNNVLKYKYVENVQVFW